MHTGLIGALQLSLNCVQYLAKSFRHRKSVGFEINSETSLCHLDSECISILSSNGERAKNCSYFIAKGKDKELCLSYIPLVLDINAH